MGKSASEFVARHHTHEQRWRSLVATLQSLRESIASGGRPALPNLEFFLPEARNDQEFSLATRGF